MSHDVLLCRHDSLLCRYETCTLQHTATRCNTLQHTATHRSTLQHTVTHYSTLATLTHCNTLHHLHTATQVQDIWKHSQDPGGHPKYIYIDIHIYIYMYKHIYPSVINYWDMTHTYTDVTRSYVHTKHSYVWHDSFMSRHSVCNPPQKKIVVCHGWWFLPQIFVESLSFFLNPSYVEIIHLYVGTSRHECCPPPLLI